MSRWRNYMKKQVISLTDERFNNPALKLSYHNIKYGKHFYHNSNDKYRHFDGDDPNIEPADKLCPYNMEQRTYFVLDGIMYSVYTDVYRGHPCNYFLRSPYDCVILLMTNTHFAGAVYKDGEMKHHKSFGKELSNIGRGSTASEIKHAEKLVNAFIERVMVEWQEYTTKSETVFLRCGKEQEAMHFTERKYSNNFIYHRTFSQIPFTISECPNLEEVRKVYERVTSVIIHGGAQESAYEIESHQDDKREAVNNTEIDIDTFVSPHRTVRRSEKQNWPSLDAGLKIRIHETILENDYDLLRDSTSEGNRMEMIDYLSAVLDKLDGQTFLHLAVKKRLENTAAFLLDFGCDPSVKDNHGRVPCEYCKTDGMKEVFVEYRANNPDLHNWNKCHIPEAIAEEVPQVKKQVLEITKNAVKEKRKQRSDAKRIFID